MWRLLEITRIGSWWCAKVYSDETGEVKNMPIDEYRRIIFEQAESVSNRTDPVPPQEDLG